MNYVAVYNDFIQNRRTKEASLRLSGAYVEKHHIYPRALGGEDISDNLISLIPEDHIRAHILLARIHGGAMYAPLSMMLGKHRARIATKIERKAFALRRILAAKYNSGEHNHNYDSRSYTFCNLVSNDVKEGVRAQLVSDTGLTYAAVTSLINGDKRSFGDWICLDSNPEKLTGAAAVRENWRNKQKEITLYHHDGRVWEGFPVDAPIRLVVLKSGGYLHSGGWYLDPQLAKTHHKRLKEARAKNSAKRGSIEGKNNPRYGAKVTEETKEAIRAAHSFGVYTTPLGQFLSAKEAGKALGLSKPAAAKIFKNLAAKITESRTIPRTKEPNFFTSRSDLIGKSFQEIGFGFSPKENS